MNFRTLLVATLATSFATLSLTAAAAEPGPMASAPLTRAQVIAETLEAQRLGGLSRGEHNVFYTPEQLQQIRQAGLRAAAMGAEKAAAKPASAG